MLDPESRVDDRVQPMYNCLRLIVLGHCVTLKHNRAILVSRLEELSGSAAHLAGAVCDIRVGGSLKHLLSLRTDPAHALLPMHGNCSLEPLSRRVEVSRVHSLPTLYSRPPL